MVSLAESLDDEEEDDEEIENLGMDAERAVHGHDWAGLLTADERGEMEGCPRPNVDGTKPRTLGDLIMEGIRKKEAEGSQRPEVMSQKLIDVYKRIGEYLAKYTSGKIPRAFKAIPRLLNWEEVLMYTSPEKWTAQAMSQASKIFASNLNAKMAQRFYNLVLLPAVRDDIASNKKLNYHYYQALRKAVFKPAAFIKGILIPLAEEGCTLREAVIIGSVISKVSIPVEHGAAALFKISDSACDWFPTTSYLMGVMINKKWALPTRAISAVVDHYYSFTQEDRTAMMEGPMPVVWHRCLLQFVEKYKYHLTAGQMLKIKETVKSHFHHQIGPEIRKELSLASRNALILQDTPREQNSEMNI
eukprot:Selendium_serpulae@DN4432_c0_g1_i1.p1